MYELLPTENNVIAQENSDLWDRGSRCRSCSKLANHGIVWIDKLPWPTWFCSYNMFRKKVTYCRFYERELGTDDED